MKKTGCCTYFAEERNREIISTFRRLVKAYNLPRREIYKRVAQSPCSRFFVTTERASIVVAAMLRGDTLPSANRKRREMYREITNRVTILISDNPKQPLSRLVEQVISQSAPEFYITPQAVKEIISRNYKKNNGRY